ncbi:MAG: AbrB/MazE/SpoVT family DNA-binding domain-containing protein [Alphaproteobacteria bacterium]|nr:AbrB/MazE/SpoVT family DNA-binding domain-containing protein [Alphaproteobacteria bacterium]MCB9975710.1 AbrB/MazE/SpoVT family DNA-binding domain-containing protein [Rhodospirillales bacterium]
MELKITKIGNSLGVVLPKDVLANLNVEKGDVLWLSESGDGITLSPYDPAFAEQMDAARKLMKKRRNALRELAK